MIATNGFKESELAKSRCFTSYSVRKKETMFINETPNYQRKNIQNINALISLKIDQNDVNEYQKPNSNTLTNLKGSQMNLQRNNYLPFYNSYYSSQALQSKQTELDMLKLVGKNCQYKDISSKANNNSYQCAQSNVRYNLNDHKKNFKSTQIQVNFKNEQQQQQLDQSNNQTFYSKSIMNSNETQAQENLGTNHSKHLKNQKHLFQIHSHLLLSKNQNTQILYDNKSGYKSIFSVDWLAEEIQHKQRGFSCFNVLIVDLKTQKYNIFKRVTPTQENPYILTQEIIQQSPLSKAQVCLLIVYIEKELQKNQYAQEVLIEKLLYKGNLLGHAQLPQDIENQILIFYFLLAFTLDGNMEKLQQVDFAMTKVKDFLDLKNQGSVSLSVKKKMIFKVINKKNMFIEDSFRKTFNVDLIRIVGEKVYKGLIYYEQGEEAFQKVDLKNYTSPAINFNAQTSQTQLGKQQRQLNEIQTYTRLQIIQQNKQRRELVSSQKIYRRPDLLRQHSQQCLRNAKTASTPISNMNRTNSQFQMKRTSNQSTDNIYKSKFPMDSVLDFQRLKTPFQQNWTDDFSSTETNGIHAQDQQRKELYSQNSLRKKQGAFNIFQQLSKQQQVSAQQNLRFQSGQINETSYKKPTYSSISVMQHKNNSSTFNLLYHDNNEVKFQDIVPFVSIFHTQQQNNPATPNYHKTPKQSEEKYQKQKELEDQQN
ncbi:hypothetical protein TTHERM_00320250 (macronuclear) [Tetrahymena thermophila SB210]|uniref:Uncharacterized protein n=1 Tax=Tetrahymena thermophila (strain SB210) TaxID=312017 RepID=Q237R2_TETTS|nr:hypothetical protein TTHERM_00320250 [Tetrahymena thermophila SB210]EAR92679.2 hypothetical protein TTHERM_00320250 [Tetrahymena thermophila SB210]|eukprot:XP_001012924.2 hypothetical protein TTHERM_00320250 [Tetrahymena thermophila SB210]